MSRRVKILIVVVLVACCVLAIGAYAYWRFLVLGPLTGDTSYDFGEVPIEAENVGVERSLHLVNRLDHPVTINAVVPDCGCITTAREPRVTLLPGEAFDLPVTLMAKAGARRVLIRVDLGDDGVQILRVTATGVPQSRLISLKPTIMLDQSGKAEFEITALVYRTDAEPPVAEITSSSTLLTGEFLGWRAGYRPIDLDEVPMEWRGTVRLISRGQDSNSHNPDLPSGTSVQVTAGPIKPLILGVESGAITGASSRPAGAAGSAANIGFIHNFPTSFVKMGKISVSANEGLFLLDTPARRGTLSDIEKGCGCVHRVQT